MFFFFDFNKYFKYFDNLKMNINDKILRGLVEAKTEKTYKFNEFFVIGYYDKGFVKGDSITAFYFTKEYNTTTEFNRWKAREVEEYYYLINTKSLSKAKRLVNSMNKRTINSGSEWRYIESTKIVEGPKSIKFKSTDEWMEFIDKQKKDSAVGYLYDDEFNSWQVWYPGEEVVENIETTGYRD